MKPFVLAVMAVAALFVLGIVSSVMAEQVAPRLVTAGRIDAIKNAIANKVGNLTNEEIGKLEIMGRALASRIEKTNASQIMSVLQNIKTKIVQKVELFRNRVIAEAQLRIAAEKLRLAKLVYEAAKLNAMDAKAKFRALNSSYFPCKNSSTTQCLEVKARILEAARNLTVNSYGRAISYLEKLRERIGSSQFINSTNAQEAVAEIDSALALLQAGKLKAQNASTLAELRNASLELKRIILKIRTMVRLHEVRVIRARVSEVFERARHLERRMELILDKLNSSGINTSGMESNLSEFSAKVDAAKDKMNSSLALFREAVALRIQAQADGNVSEAEHAQIAEKLNASRSLAKEAQTLLREAHAILVDIAKQVKSAVRGMGQQVSDAELLDAGAATAIVQEPAQVEVVEVDSGE